MWSRGKKYKIRLITSIILNDLLSDLLKVLHLLEETAQIVIYGHANSFLFSFTSYTELPIVLGHHILSHTHLVVKSLKFKIPLDLASLKLWISNDSLLHRRSCQCWVEFSHVSCFLCKMQRPQQTTQQKEIVIDFISTGWPPPGLTNRRHHHRLCLGNLHFPSTYTRNFLLAITTFINWNVLSNWNWRNISGVLITPFNYSNLPSSLSVSPLDNDINKREWVELPPSFSFNGEIENPLTIIHQPPLYLRLYAATSSNLIRCISRITLICLLKLRYNKFICNVNSISVTITVVGTRKIKLKEIEIFSGVILGHSRVKSLRDEISIISNPQRVV